MSQGDKFLPTTPTKSEPKKRQQRKESKTEESYSFSPLYPIYWIRILEVLQERKNLEDDYSSNPKTYEGREGDYKDLENEGLGKEDLSSKLGMKISNSKIRGIDYNEVLIIMIDPVSPYINVHSDKSKKDRYRITRFGILALKQISNDDILSGYWDLVKKTNLPKKEQKIF
jgi:hypothetical protein